MISYTLNWRRAEPWSRKGVSEERGLESVLGRPLECNYSRLGRTHCHEGALRRTHYAGGILMRNAIKSLAFVAAIEGILNLVEIGE